MKRPMADVIPLLFKACCKALLLCLCCFWGIAELCAQGTGSNWFFGRQAGLRFQGAQAQLYTQGAMNALEGCVAISDAEGNLLFYSNGSTVWNRFNQPMVNGTGLGGHSSSSQAALAAPFPGHPGQYFLFTTDKEGLGPMEYARIDMRLQSGAGEVVQKRQFMHTAMGEQLAAVRHANRDAWWIIGRSANSNAFRAWLLDAGGLSLQPVVSFAGTPDPGGMGCLSVSPDGKRLVLALRNLHIYELYRFDPSTGWVSQPQQMSRSFHQSYGAAFSPDGNKLYLCSSRDGNTQAMLFQTDLRAYAYPTVIGGFTVIDSIKIQFPGALQLAPDGRIYLARHNDLFLGVISNPNAAGAACGFQDEGLFLGGKLSQFGLPNLLHNQILPPPQIAHSGLCAGEALTFSLRNVIAIDSVQWMLYPGIAGSQYKGFSVSYAFPKPGVHRIRAVYFRGTKADTVAYTFDLFERPALSLPHDTTFCEHQHGLLFAGALPQALPVTYLWQDSVNTPTRTILQAGVYSVTATNLCGQRTDSVRVTFLKAPQLSLGNDTLLCQGQKLLLRAEWPGAQAVWAHGEQEPVFWVRSPGIYKAILLHPCGSAADSIQVQFEARPIIEIGPDTVLCNNDLLLLSAIPLRPYDRIRYLWQDASTHPLHVVRTPGTYRVQVSTLACVVSDSIHVQYAQTPQLNLGQDQVLCEDNELLLEVRPAQGSAVIWQDGSMDSVFMVQKPGIYWAQIENACGLASDTIRVEYLPKPRVNLGHDTLICPLRPFLLQINPQQASIRWENGATESRRIIQRAGEYRVWVENGCGIARDTLIVEADLAACDCQVFVPNVFSPNGDGLNEVFKVDFPCEALSYQLDIFDRYGVRVCRLNNPLDTWDGNIHDKNCPTGAYYYVLRYLTAGRLEGLVKGTVTLVR